MSQKPMLREQVECACVVRSAKRHMRKLELELILSRWLWERGEKGGASLQKQARVRALCGVMQ
jgi:hypothetical protein